MDIRFVAPLRGLYCRVFGLLIAAVSFSAAIILALSFFTTQRVFVFLRVFFNRGYYSFIRRFDLKSKASRNAVCYFDVF